MRKIPYNFADGSSKDNSFVYAFLQDFLVVVSKLGHFLMLPFPYVNWHSSERATSKRTRHGVGKTA